MCDDGNMVLPNATSAHIAPMDITGESTTQFDINTAPAGPSKISSLSPEVLLDDMASENYWLRQKMKEITADRDRLLCEVANLRLELDMSELKRLPEDK